MTKRMVIMLVAVALVFGGVFGFQAFKGAMTKNFMSSMSNPPNSWNTERRKNTGPMQTASTNVNGIFVSGSRNLIGFVASRTGMFIGGPTWVRTTRSGLS